MQERVLMINGDNIRIWKIKEGSKVENLDSTSMKSKEEELLKGNREVW